MQLKEKVCDTCGEKKNISFFSKTGIPKNGCVYYNNDCNSCVYSKRKGRGDIKIVYNLEGEEWIGIQGFENYYMVSNFGRMKRMSKTVSLCKKIPVRNEYIQNGCINPDGYIVVKISIDTKTISRLLHRLVALAFISNPENLEQVNHIDGNKLNNSVSNLEWCTNYYNQQHRRILFNGFYTKKQLEKSCSLN